MKKSQLKQILKPLVNECIKESLMEDGLISGIIAEVVKGMSSSPQPIVESQQPPVDPTAERIKRNAFSAEQTQKMQDHRATLMEAIGKDSYNGVNLFEGTIPAPAASSTASPLANQAPHDPGVDISGLFGSVGRSWDAHMNDVKDRK